MNRYQPKKEWYKVSHPTAYPGKRWYQYMTSIEANNKILLGFEAEIAPGYQPPEKPEPPEQTPKLF